MKKGIVFLKGGFGNQLFQFSFANFLKENDHKVLINTELFKEPGYDTPRQLLLPINYFGFKQQSKISYNFFKANMRLNTSKKFEISGLNKIFEKYKFTKDDYNFFEQNYKIKFFNGYWKEMKYVSASKNFLVESLKNDLRIKKGFDNSVNRALVHVRRGDFIKDNRHLNSSYYKKGLEILRNKDKSIEYDIFTDDLDWVKSNSIFKDVNKIYSQKSGRNNKSEIDSMDDKDETIETFSSMIQYKHFIIGNSSFAFWAAYLNSDNNTIVTVPDPWFRDSFHPILKDKNWFTVPNLDR